VYYHSCKGTCGGSQCIEWALARLSTVSEQVYDLLAEYDLEASDLVRLTGLIKDVPAPTMGATYRDGYAFAS